MRYAKSGVQSCVQRPIESCVSRHFPHAPVKTEVAIRDTIVMVVRDTAADLRQKRLQFPHPLPSHAPPCQKECLRLQLDPHFDDFRDLLPRQLRDIGGRVGLLRDEPFELQGAKRLADRPLTDSHRLSHLTLNQLLPWFQLASQDGRAQDLGGLSAKRSSLWPCTNLRSCPRLSSCR